MEKITFDKRNYRRHDEKNKRVIRKSLEELGAGRSVLIDKNNTLIAGNGVFEQAQALGIPVRVIETDGTELVAVKRTDIAEGDEKRKRLALADNVASDLSDFDDDLLHEDFSMEELSEWGLESEEEIVNETKEAQEDDFDEEKDKVETVCKKGDIWQLGNHRLMCGSCTDKEAMKRLMNGERADIAFTSPPYNLMGGFNLHPNQADGYLGGKNAYDEYAEDRTDEGYANFLTEALDNCLSHADDTFFNIGYTRGALIGTALFLGQNAKMFCGAIRRRWMPVLPPCRL